METETTERTDETGYNGWKNYETWVTALWIDNDEGSYNYSRELVAHAQADMANDSTRMLTLEIADALREWQEETINDLTADVPNCIVGDLLGHAFGQIDWYEIAENYLSEV